MFQRILTWCGAVAMAVSAAVAMAAPDQKDPADRQQRPPQPREASIPRTELTGTERIAIIDNNRVATMRLNFSDQRTTFDPASHETITSVQDPRWCPTSDRIAFSGRHGVEARRIYWVHWDGSDLRQMTTDPAPQDKQVFDVTPAWAPDGQQLAFARAIKGWGQDLKWDIWIQRVGAPAPTNLTASGGHSEWQPDYSPDGSKIAFVRKSLSGPSFWKLCVMNADGSDAQQVTTGLGDESWPRWSRDGKRIAFLRKVSNRDRVFVIKQDGTDEQQITEGETGINAVESWDKRVTWVPPQNNELLIVQYYLPRTRLLKVNLAGGHSVVMDRGPDQLDYHPAYQGQPVDVRVARPSKPDPMRDLSRIEGLTPRVQKELSALGIGDLEKLSKADPRSIAGRVRGVSVAQATEFVREAKRLVEEPTPRPPTDGARQR